MEYSSARASGPTSESRSAPTSYFRSGRMFLLDSMQTGRHPTLYQLKDHTLDKLLDKDNKMISLKSEDFLAVGDVRSVDKEKKIIYMEDGNLISYEHLITSSTVDPHLLSSTICALRVQYQSKDNLTPTLTETSSQSMAQRMKIQQAASDSSKLSQLPLGHSHSKTISATLNGRECLYELYF